MVERQGRVVAGPDHAGGEPAPQHRFGRATDGGGIARVMIHVRPRRSWLLIAMRDFGRSGR